MRVGLLLAVAFALSSLYLGVRLYGLEQRLGTLKRQLGTPSATSQTPASSDAGNPTAASQEQRIARLEADMHALEQKLDALASRPSAPVAPTIAGGEDQILSVVGRAQRKVIEKQLEFHKTRWVEGREAAVKYFTQHYGLNPQQNTELEHLMSTESQQLVSLMSRPHAFDDMDKLSGEWLSALGRTDMAARQLLNPTQHAAWAQARVTERMTLWPWLPKDAPPP